jgi:hypothetical protein
VNKKCWSVRPYCLDNRLNCCEVRNVDDDDDDSETFQSVRHSLTLNSTVLCADTIRRSIAIS